MSPDCACGAAARQEVARAEGFDGRLRPESEFFEYVVRAYRCFLAGDDPGAEAVDGEQAAAFGARSAETEERNQRLEQARPLPCMLHANAVPGEELRQQPCDQAAALRGQQRAQHGLHPAPAAGTPKGWLCLALRRGG